MVVLKRDGRKTEFNRDKIVNAILGAFKEVDGEINPQSHQKATKIAKDIEEMITDTVSVETIQDMVEEKLMATNRKDVAKAYVRYRYKRELRREAMTKLDYDILGVKNGTSETTRDNANKDGKKLQTLKPMIADVTIIDQGKRLILPEKVMKEHGKKMYVHDMNYAGLPLVNCMVVNWEEVLNGEMIIGNAPIEEVKSFYTAIALISQMASHVSSNCYGGVTFPRIVKGLSIYAQKSLNKYREEAKRWVDDELIEDYAWEHLKKEIKDGCQSLEYEIQTLTNSRGEIPFLTIELDCVDLEANEELQRIQYMICEAYLRQRINGLSGDVTPVFPKIVFETKRGNNLDPTDKYYSLFKLAIECSSKRVYPDYLMHDKIVEVTGSYKPPMSCRSYLPKIILDGKEYPYGFNQGVVSVNLVRHAILANGNEDKFYELLKETLDELVVPAHMIRHNQLKTVKASQAPILFMYGIIARLKADETIESLLYKDRSSISIGYVGIHNALNALYGKSFDKDIDMIEKGQKMLNFLSDYCNKLKEETNIGFSLYGTPAEVLATKFCRADIEDFGIIEGVTDNGYYENSFHYPSNEEVNAFDKIDIESQMSHISTGGAIQYVEMGDMTKNTEALETIVRYAYDKCHYFGVNTASDRCYKCGYIGQMVTTDETNEHYKCPQCGNEDKSKMSVIRRLCGYLGSLSERPSIDGKMKEIAHRTKHVKCGECE